MTTTPPDVIGPLMQAVLDCAEQKLTAYGRPAGRVLLSSGGDPAWDECCEGLLWVRLVTSYPSGNPFPQQDLRPSNCGALYASQLGIGVLRCAQVVDDNADAPTAEEITTETLGMTADYSILVDAIRCCIQPLADDSASNLAALTLGTWTPLGPDGGCVGGEWTLTIGHGACGCD